MSDIDQARKEGYSSSEIVDYFGAKGLDVESARKEGYSDDEILKHFESKSVSTTPEVTQSRSLPEKLIRQVGLTARAPLQAAGGLLAMPGDAALGLITGQRGRSSAALDAFLNRFLPSPENPTERVVQGINQAVSGAGALSAGAKLAKPISDVGTSIVRNLTANMPGQLSSAAAGGAASSVADEYDAPWYAKIPLSLAASFLGGKATSRFDDVPAPTYKPAVAEKLDDFARAGTTPSAGQATGSSFYQALENIVGRMPGGQSVIRNFRTRQQEQLGKSVDTGVSARIGGQAVERGITGSGGFLSRTSNQWRQLDDQLAKQVGNDTMVEPTKTVGVLEKLTQRVDDPAINKILTNPKLNEFRNAVEKSAKTTKKTVEFPTDFSFPVTTSATPGMLPFKTLRELRKEVGLLLDDASISPDFKKGELRALYASLSDDLKVAAQRSGDASLKTWNRQNKLWRGRQDRVDSVLDKVIGKDKTDEDILLSLSPKGADEVTRIRTVMKSLPKEERKIATDAIVNRLGRAVPSKQTELGDRFSSETFLTNWSKLSGPARQVLFPDAEHRRAVEAIAKVSSVIRQQAEVFPNISNSAGASTPYVLGFGAAQGPVGLTIAAATVAGSNIGMRMLTNPVIAKWLAQTAAAPPSRLASHFAQLQVIYNQTDDEGTKADLSSFVDSVQQP